jgi:hypothetical protein
LGDAAVGGGVRIYSSRLVETRLLGMFVLLLMLSLEFALNQRADRHQEQETRQVILKAEEVRVRV